MVVSVLLQPGKADAGALFSSSVSSTAFGPRGTQTLLAKITIGAAAAFMLLGLALSFPAVTGSHSVVQGESEETAQPQASPATPVTPAPAGETPANTNAAPADTGGATPPATNASPAAAAPAQSAPAAASPQGQQSPAQK
ncbi:MAG: Preprotein translocase SecG subunit [Blastocatellia bacterium]|nr:Preprotein translocase SecG subunit [Blastocatellia bacterium]